MAGPWLLWRQPFSAEGEKKKRSLAAACEEENTRDCCLWREANARLLLVEGGEGSAEEKGEGKWAAAEP